LEVFVPKIDHPGALKTFVNLEERETLLVGRAHLVDLEESPGPKTFTGYS